MAIQLPDEAKRELAGTLKRFFREERDEEIGDLQAGLFLDFILEEIGPAIYNQAVRDARVLLQEVIGDLDVRLYETTPVKKGGKTRRT